MELNRRKEKGQIVIYNCQSGKWQKFGKPELPRSITSIILKEGVITDLVEDISNFRKNGDWYRNLGIPYRRGYLLFGPPGCGKSSFIRAVAGHLGLGICLLSLNDVNLNDQVINRLLNDSPGNCIIVIEDIDAAMPSREITTTSTNLSLTLSGLLNALDGIGSQEGRLLFMTTNKRDRLDPALVRPGRVDRYVEFGLANREQIEGFFMKVFPNAPTNLAKQISSIVPSHVYSMAELQKYFMFFREDPEAAVSNSERIQDLISETNSLLSP
eukprot:TRINITY_DN3478_c0_g1_i3.p1 TRINITY_DN3478_c0_g1~~TRINITY_DN3478_c0_g1_i3.p1  ORF type:complete len:270 (-),score=55.00 TRINITY_DN3478_c0_g1_i3:203-1012(-)